jgi:HAD superfamily hydrolase (TIGR01509 family)
VRYLFYDLDDTLVRTTDHWLAAATAYLARRNLTVEEKSIYRFLGKNCKDICLDIAAHYENTLIGGIDACAEEFRNYLRLQHINSPAIEIPGATDFLRMMSRTAIQCVASGSPIDIIERIITDHGWGSHITHFVTSEAVSNGKPDPEIYDNLRQSCHADPDDCLIFEDSPAGIEAASRAGIRCVVINPKFPTLIQNNIIAVANDFTDLVGQPDWNRVMHDFL